MARRVGPTSMGDPPGGPIGLTLCKVPDFLPSLRCTGSPNVAVVLMSSICGSEDMRAGYM